MTSSDGGLVDWMAGWNGGVCSGRVIVELAPEVEFDLILANLAWTILVYWKPNNIQKNIRYINQELG